MIAKNQWEILKGIFCINFISLFWQNPSYRFYLLYFTSRMVDLHHYYFLVISLWGFKRIIIVHNFSMIINHSFIKKNSIFKINGHFRNPASNVIASSLKVSSNILLWLHQMINISTFWNNKAYKFISSQAFSVFFLTLSSWLRYYKIACILLRRKKPRVYEYSHESKSKSREEIRDLIFMTQPNQAKCSFIACGLSKEQNSGNEGSESSKQC